MSGTPATEVYKLLLGAVEPWRAERFPGMENFSEFAGLADRSYQKLLHPDPPSGRQGNWPTIDRVMRAVFPDGYTILIVPNEGPQTAESIAEYRRRFARRIPNITGAPVPARASQSSVASP